MDSTLNGSHAGTGNKELWIVSMNQDRDEPVDVEKLRLLQAAGGVRSWASLDEIRQCVLCESAFSGRQVRIMRDRDGHAHLLCATVGCPATPAQWIHPGNPLISEDAWRDWVHLLDRLCDDPGRHQVQPVAAANRKWSRQGRKRVTARSREKRGVAFQETAFHMSMGAATPQGV